VFHNYNMMMATVMPAMMDYNHLLLGVQRL
jgi:hypothetical protein